MPSIINATTTTGLVTTADNSGSLQLATNSGTTAVTIDTSQNVGIGETSPAGSANYTQLVIRGTNGAELSLKGGATQYGYVYVDNGGFRIINPQSGASSGTLQFHTSNTERGRFTAGGDFQFNSGYGSVATGYGCRAWVNFNGTGTVAIRASGNVSSITDNGTGNYTINFTTALTDANYSGVFGCNDNGNTTCMNYRTGGTKTTTAFQVSTVADGANLTDNDMAMVAVFR